MTADSARARYLADAVATATPAKRIVMLFDRLWLDVQRGQTALASAEPTSARDHTMHAQQIVAELLGSLDLTAWDGADNLAGIYGYLLNEFTDAIVKPVAGRLDTAVSIVEKLREAWQQAEQALTGTSTTPATAAAAAAAAGSSAVSAASTAPGLAGVRNMAWVS